MGDIYWVGNAAPVAQVTTFTFAGVWNTPDTATIKVNDKSVTITLGAVSNSTTDAAAAMAAALNSSDSSTTTQDLISDETKNIGGQQIAEFREFTAVAAGSVVTCTGTTDGLPFVAVSSETAAGSGTTSPTTTTLIRGRTAYAGRSSWNARNSSRWTPHRPVHRTSV